MEETQEATEEATQALEVLQPTEASGEALPIESQAETMRSTESIQDNTATVQGEEAEPTVTESTQVSWVQEENTSDSQVTTLESTAESLPTEVQESQEAVGNAEVVQLTSYTIMSGDTLIGISTRMYGTEHMVKEICRLNNISNPDDIKVGAKILLP